MRIQREHWWRRTTGMLAIAVCLAGAACSGTTRQEQPVRPTPNSVAMKLVGKDEYRRRFATDFPRYDWPTKLAPDYKRLAAESQPPDGMLVPIENADIVLGMVNSCA
jgi:hypothetical protein